MRRLTNEIVDERLKPLNIKREGDYINVRTPLPLRCIVCDFSWAVKPRHILIHNSGCPSCNDTRLNDIIFDDFLKNKNIKRLDPYINAREPSRFQCQIEICKNSWITTPRSILYEGTGCPRCFIESLRLSNKDIDEKLSNLNIERLSDYIDAKHDMIFKCMIKRCNHIWEAKPSKIINQQNGCPKCSWGKNEKLVFSFLVESKIEFDRQFLVKIPEYKSPKRVDFYISKLNLIIEYNGDQHYKVVCFGSQSIDDAKIAFDKQQVRDQAIRNYCQEHNINLLEIDGRKYTGKKLLEFLCDYFDNINVLTS